MMQRNIKIVFATIFQNSGDATRALEIAKAIRDNHPENYSVKITFISRGSRFETDAEQEGFHIYKAKPTLGGVQYLDDFQTRFGELIGNVSLAKTILQGEKEALFEVIRMFNAPDCQWSGIVLCPPAICHIAEARALLKNPDVILTDAFVHAAEINARVDAVVCHGGQGTLQTAILSGTPLVGMPAQPEQQMNLQHLSEYGMAISIPPYKWNARNISKSVNRIFCTPSYKERAVILQQRALKLNPRRIIVDKIWEKLI